jgi:hypothetical protein
VTADFFHSLQQGLIGGSEKLADGHSNAGVERLDLQCRLGAAGSNSDGVLRWNIYAPAQWLEAQSDFSPSDSTVGRWHTANRFMMPRTAADRRNGR